MDGPNFFQVDGPCAAKKSGLSTLNSKCKKQKFFVQILERTFDFNLRHKKN